MKGEIPAGTRPMREMTLLLNVAMGGNVCGGKRPAPGSYDMVVYNLLMSDTLEGGGWDRFERDWHSSVTSGNTY